MKSKDISADWDADKLRRLRTLWDEGMSTASIGVQLGVTRNAVIGKAHRMGLQKRPNKGGRAAGAPRISPEERKRRTLEAQRLRRAAKKNDPDRAPVALVVVARPMPIAAPVVREEPAGDGLVFGEFSLSEMVERRGCRWPNGHVPNITFCGRKRDPKDPNHNYCDEHLRRATRPAVARVAA